MKTMIPEIDAIVNFYSPEIYREDSQRDRLRPQEENLKTSSQNCLNKEHIYLPLCYHTEDHP